MSSFTITDLREVLANTIRDLRDPKSGMTVDKAKAIGDLSQTLINSAKIEVEALKVLGRGRMKPTGFIAIEHQDTLDGQDSDAGAAPQPAGGRKLGQAPRSPL